MKPVTIGGTIKILKEELRHFTYPNEHNQARYTYKVLSLEKLLKTPKPLYLVHPCPRGTTAIDFRIQYDLKK